MMLGPLWDAYIPHSSASWSDADEMRNGPIPDLSQRTRRHGGQGGDGSSPEGWGAPQRADVNVGATGGDQRRADTWVRPYDGTAKDAGKMPALRKGYGGTHTDHRADTWVRPYETAVSGRSKAASRPPHSKGEIQRF